MLLWKNRKTNREKLIAPHKAMCKNICPLKFMRLSPWLRRALCCLMAAVVSDWQCANATHSVQTCQSGSWEKKYKMEIKVHAPPWEEGSGFLSLLAGAPRTKRLGRTNDSGDENHETEASDKKHQSSSKPLPHLAADMLLDVTLQKSFALKQRKKHRAPGVLCCLIQNW